MVVRDLVKRSVCEFVFACYVSDSAYRRLCGHWLCEVEGYWIVCEE